MAENKPPERKVIVQTSETRINPTLQEIGAIVDGLIDQAHAQGYTDDQIQLIETPDEKYTAQLVEVAQRKRKTSKTPRHRVPIIDIKTRQPKP